MTRIIDARNRPALLHDFYGKTPGSEAAATTAWLSERTGSHDRDHFVRSRTIEGYRAELDDAGIHRAIVVGRDTPAIRHDDAEIAALVAQDPRLVGLGSIDPHGLDSDEIGRRIEAAVRKHGLRGINIEPAFLSPARAADDPALRPVYAACRDLGVPVTIMSGPTSPSLDQSDPAATGRVARQFPELTLVVYHGAWPYVNEALGVAFRYPNVVIVPDMYLFLPGGQLYVEAGNGFLRHQLLFASSYPFRALRQTVEDFLRLGWREEVLDGLLHGNAERVFGIEG